LLQFLEVTHHCEVLQDFSQLLWLRLLIQLLQQRYIRFELLVEIAHVDECAEELWRENHLEGFTILFNGVHKAKTAQTV
jgi:hypothetical protein